MSQAPDAPPGLGARVWREVGPILVAVGIAILLRIFVIDSFRIPSSSMFPTLLIGDHLFVDKLAYGPRIPFTEIRFPPRRAPKRGDVVVFIAARRGMGVVPADRRPDLPREDFIKRIVAVPGDTVEVRDDVLVVNGQVLPHESTGEIFRDELNRTLAVHTEDLLGCMHEWLQLPGVRGPEQSRFTVEPGRYFMMGDNRDNSNDSRIWGTVRFEEIKGPAWRFYFSWDFNGGWLSLLNPATYLGAEWRWDRVGDRIGCS